MKHLITPRTSSADIQCVIMGSLGFSWKYIMSRTGLSKAQVHRRLRQTQSLVRLYRNGETALAVRIADLSREQSKSLVDQLQKQIKKSSLAARPH